MPNTHADIFEFVPDCNPDGQWLVVDAASRLVVAAVADEAAALALSVRMSQLKALERHRSEEGWGVLALQ